MTIPEAREGNDINKRVWIFNHYAYPPRYAGGHRHFNFAKYLSQAGYEPVIFHASAVHNKGINIIEDKRGYLAKNVDGTDFVILRTRNYKGNGRERILNMIDYYRGLMKYYKRFAPPDIIYASSVHPLALVAGIKIAKRLGIKCICEVRDLWPAAVVEYSSFTEKNAIIKVAYEIEKWIYKKADALVFTAPGGKDYIVEKGWDKEIDLGKVYHINNGVDLEAFSENKDIPFDDDDLHDPSKYKIIFAGAVTQAIRLKTIVDAFRIVKQKGYDNIELLVYGDGADRRGLEKMCRKKGINNVKFKGEIPKGNVPYALVNGDALIVSPFRTDALFRYGMSLNKLFDYFAALKPIIFTMPIKYDLVEYYDCGITTKSDPASIAQGIIDMYELPEERKAEMRKNCIRAAEDYDFKVLTQKLIKIIRRLTPKA